MTDSFAILAHGLNIRCTIYFGSTVRAIECDKCYIKPKVISL